MTPTKQDPTPPAPMPSAPPAGGRSGLGVLARVAFLLMSGALISKVLGFVREILMAQIIGVAMVADGFRTAVTLILLPIAFLQNESMPAILIPMQQDAQARGEAPRRLASLTIALTLIALAITLLTEVFAVAFVDAVVKGFSAEGHALTATFVHIMALSMPASVMLNCLAAGEISSSRTRITNARAFFLNVGVIAGLGALALGAPIVTLAWAFTASFNGLAVWATVALWRERRLDFTGLDARLVRDDAVEFLRRLRPFLGLPAAEQGAIWIERLQASRILTGAVASLDYARTLTESALLLVSQPIGLAVLSSRPAEDQDRRVEVLSRAVLALALPASAFLVVFAPDIVRLVFARGAFGELGVRLTSEALTGIAVGLWASTLGWILLRVLNGTGRSRTAAFILIAAHAVNMAFNLGVFLIVPMDSTGVLLLGLGDAARSLVLLAGVAITLGFGRRLLGLIAIGMIPAAAMIGLGLLVRMTFGNALVDLVLGAVVCVFTILIAEKILFPEIYTLLLSWIRARRDRRRNAA